MHTLLKRLKPLVLVLGLFVSLIAPSITMAGDFSWPINGTVSQTVAGHLSTESQRAVDITNGGSNIPVRAAADGVVYTASTGGNLLCHSQDSNSNGYGNYVVLKHTTSNGTLYTLYAHLSTVNVTAGASIARGVQLGVMGNTGCSFGQHVHFAIGNSACPNVSLSCTIWTGPDNANGTSVSTSGMTGGSYPQLDSALPIRMVVNIGGNLSYKDGSLGTSLFPLWAYPTATKVYASGNRVGFLENTGKLYVREDMNHDWVNMYPGYTVDEAIITPTRVLIRSGGYILLKDGALDNAWQTIWAYPTAARIYTNGTRIGFLENTGHLYIRESMNYGWEDQYSAGGVTDAIVTQTRVLISRSGALSVKDGSLGLPFTLIWQYPTASKVYLSGTRIAFVENTGHLFVRESMNYGWEDQYTPGGVTDVTFN